MGAVKNMAKELAKEIGNKSREFYEFVLPPVDMILEDNSLAITIDMPGFEKKDIKLSIHKNILNITAQKPESKTEGIIYKQRPNIIDKKILLPVHIEEDAVISAKLSQGVLTVKVPYTKKEKSISIE
ncbi:MAG: Hsp20/alpha crystallin family protein [Nitrososphaeria archaeon]|nr:Hsp20/alpha crystallin family protein [Nitrosopumilaceae archaeon]NDB87814.1 Hsp20/alpha crystallin family protein [Nitrososphaerota archaeon]NDB90327.1 Hsp20/alpha crystallin family protein [Nitrososphaerota archaeon]NDB91660.1 Hsp20/alpha crystallin family protein [Nitrososphaeria archaeon]NDF26612.1 Hsp20/alpha crystallin family protein [Nitrosopumilaceae archaeon]